MQMERQTRRAHGVNLTPLIDVVFLLIVFFMLSTTFTVSESMELSIPSDQAKTIMQDTVWVMRVHESGRIFSDDEDYDVSDLDREIRRRLEANPDQKMLVLATPGSTVQQLVNVLDVIYVNGGRQVQIDHANLHGASNDVKLAN